MAGKTVRSAKGALAALFRFSIGRSPLHHRCGDQEEGEKLLPGLNKLFSGMEANSLNVIRQKAITPKLLPYLPTSSAILNEPKDHAANLIVRAFFFAMRACEYVKIPVPAKTRRVGLGCIHFLSRKRNHIRHNYPIY